MKYLQESLLYLTALAFGLLYCRHLFGGIFWRAPFFACYAAVACVYGLAFDPADKSLLLLFQPLLLSLKMSMVIEAFILATDGASTSEKRWALLAIASPAAVVLMILLILGYLPSDDPWSMYPVVRLYVHTWLAALCLFGAVVLWSDPPPMQPSIRAHCLTLICYFLSHMVINLTNPQTMTEWRYLSCVSLGATSVCVWYWLRYGLASRVSPFLKVLNPAS